MIYGVWCEFYTRPLPLLWKQAETKTAIKDPVNYVRQVLEPCRTTGAQSFSERFYRDLHLRRTVQLQCNLHYNYCAGSIARMLIQSQAIKGRSVYNVVKRAGDRGMGVLEYGLEHLSWSARNLERTISSEEITCRRQSYSTQLACVEQESEGEDIKENIWQPLKRQRLGLPQLHSRNTWMF